jgi:hypothetical protein
MALASMMGGSTTGGKGGGYIHSQFGQLKILGMKGGENQHQESKLKQ